MMRRRRWVKLSNHPLMRRPWAEWVPKPGSHLDSHLIGRPQKSLPHQPPLAAAEPWAFIHCSGFSWILVNENYVISSYFGWRHGKSHKSLLHIGPLHIAANWLALYYFVLPPHFTELHIDPQPPAECVGRPFQQTPHCTQCCFKFQIQIWHWLRRGGIWGEGADL